MNRCNKVNVGDNKLLGPHFMRLLRAWGFIQISVINNMEMRKKLTVCIIFLSAAGEASGLNENLCDLYLYLAICNI